VTAHLLSFAASTLIITVATLGLTGWSGDRPVGHTSRSVDAPAPAPTRVGTQVGAER
jgi:hypothetical protein